MYPNRIIELKIKKMFLKFIKKSAFKKIKQIES